jgi:methionyl-tRNA formyltransferase
MIQKVSIIAAATLRSHSYLNLLLSLSVTIERIFILDDGNFLPGQRCSDKNGSMASKLIELANNNKIVFSIFSSNVNDKALVKEVSDLASSLIVYSGFGGQILKNDILSCGKKILHIHSGLLPEYRGSTTIYYALLNNDNLGATAILLDQNIDTGIIVGERSYPRPEKGVDIDFDLDIQYRSKLLSTVVRDFVSNGSFKMEKKQDMNAGKTYYIAHPVLRHIALLSNR